MVTSDILSSDRVSFWFNRVIKFCWAGNFRSGETKEMRGFRLSLNEIIIQIRSSKAYVKGLAILMPLN